MVLIIFFLIFFILLGTSKVDCQNANTYRPCPNFSLECISSWFQQNGRRRSPAPGNANSFTALGVAVYFPYFNVSMVEGCDRVFKFNSASVSEFIINSDTDETVISVDFQDLCFFGPTSYFHYNPGVEPTFFFTNSTEEFAYARTTTVFRGTCDLDLLQSTTVANPSPITFLDLGKGFRKNRDPRILYRINLMTCQIDVSVKEIFWARAPVLLGYFLQSRICDFQLPHNKVPYTPFL